MANTSAQTPPLSYDEAAVLNILRYQYKQKFPQQTQICDAVSNVHLTFVALLHVDRLEIII